MPSCLFRNVSTSFQPKFKTVDGDVTITQFKRGLWQVQPRGEEPFMVRSRRRAMSEACAIAARKRRK